jgi:tryptophanyl-tRNA synthetase
MITDPNRKRRIDPGDPNKCPVFDYHKVFSTEDEMKVVIEGCTKAKIGCIDCKRILLTHLTEFLNDFQEKRESISNNFRDKDIYEIVDSTQKKAVNKAKRKMMLIREALKF